MLKVVFIALIVGLVSPKLFANSTVFFINGYSDNYTPSVPVVDFFDSWKGAKKYQKADRAYANEFLQAGIKLANFSFAAFYRYDYNIRMHSDVAEYRYTFHNHRDQLVDKDYIYDFDEQRLTSSGLRLGYEYVINENFSSKVYINLLSSKKYQQRNISDGFINGKTRLGDANANYYFSEDTLYDFLDVNNSPRGYGASLDIELKYKSDNYDLALIVLDLGHFVRWNKSPYAIGEFNVNHFIYNQDQVRNQQPLANLQTHEGSINKSFTMHLPLRAKLSLNKRLSERYSVAIKYNYNEIFNSTEVSLAYKVNDKFNFSTSYNLNTKGYGVKVQYAKYYIELITDDIKFSYANNLSLFLGMEIKI